MAGAGLNNSAQAKRILFDGPARTVIDGPFAGGRELVAGFSIREVEHRRGDGLAIVAWRWLTTKSTAGKAQFES